MMLHTDDAEDEDNHGGYDRDDDAGGDNINLKETMEFAKTWDPRNRDSPTALDGWLFPRFMAFVCFGPTSRHYALTL